MSRCKQQTARSSCAGDVGCKNAASRCSGPIDHEGMIESIYFHDPNGIRLELTIPLDPQWNQPYRAGLRGPRALGRDQGTRQARGARPGQGAGRDDPRNQETPSGSLMAEFERIPVIISFAEQLTMVETYGFTGSQGKTVLEGQRLVPRGRPSDTVFLFMHPASTLHLLPMPTALAGAGLHVLCAAQSLRQERQRRSSWRRWSTTSGMYVRHAREETLGYKKVDPGRLVRRRLAVALLRSAARAAPSITQTPAGDPYDLTAANLPRADGIIFIAAHLSRRRDADRMAGYLAARRNRPGPAHPGARHLRSALPAQASVLDGVRGEVPRRPGRTQPPHHGLGDREARNC